MIAGRFISLFLLLGILGFGNFCQAATNCIVSSNTPINNTALKRLKVVGKKIKTTTGKTIALKGFNFTNNYYMDNSAYKTAACDYATETDVKRIAGLGANSIRLVLRWDYFSDANNIFSPTNYKTLGYALIDQYIRWGQKYGVYIILDLHIVPDDLNFGDNTIWSSSAARQKFLDLWLNLAKRYKNNNTIAGYDIYNEPAPYTNNDWWGLAQDTVNTIRLTGDQHIIYIEAPVTGDAMFGSQPLIGGNLVYSFHTYEPFLISHYGIADLSPIPVSSDYSYPGKVLIDTVWKTWAQDGNEVTTKLPSWKLVKNSLTVPSNVGAEFATIKLAVNGNTGNVWFDNIAWKLNGFSKKLWNGEAEQLVANNSPLIWSFWGDHSTGQVSTTIKYAGNASLQIDSNQGLGVWSQGNGSYINQLLRIKPNDKIDIQAMVYAPNNAGSISVSVDYLKGIYRNYSAADTAMRLRTVRDDMTKYLSWGELYQVPLYIGEVGAISNAGVSRLNLIRDKLQVLNNEGLSWSLWTYRDMGASNSHFGLYLNNQLDSALLPVVANAMK